MRRFQCPHCGRWYRKQKGVDKHVRNAHAQQATFVRYRRMEVPMTPLVEGTEPTPRTYKLTNTRIIGRRYIEQATQWADDDHRRAVRAGIHIRRASEQEIRIMAELHQAIAYMEDETYIANLRAELDRLRDARYNERHYAPPTLSHDQRRWMADRLLRNSMVNLNDLVVAPPVIAGYNYDIYLDQWGDYMSMDDPDADSYDT